MSKEKKIIFSEEIDSSINGFSVGVSLVTVALFIWFGGLLHNRVADATVTIVFLIIGILGTFLEIEKVNHNEIKGIGDLGMGSVFGCLSIFLIFKFDILVLNVISLVVLLFGTFAIFSGILKLCYSIKIQKRKTENKKVEVFKIITGLTEIIALVVVVLQLISELA